MSNSIETKLDRIIELLERLDRHFDEKFPAFAKRQTERPKSPLDEANEVAEFLLKPGDLKPLPEGWKTESPVTQEDAPQ